MSVESQTSPDVTKNVGDELPLQEMMKDIVASSQTGNASFTKISHYLSTRELRKPRSSSLSGKTLKQLAKENPPAPEWYEAKEERPF
jgi:hypothetical protein